MELYEGNSEQLKVTSINDLRDYSRGTIVQLPDFAEGQPFIARVQRPSMMKLAGSGKIPNTLLAAAGDVFSGGAKNDEEGNLLPNLYEVARIMADATLIEPSLADIEGAGMELTDEQYMAIMSYSQNGVSALESFRK